MTQVDEQADALRELKALQKLDVLKIVTNEHVCGGGVHPAVDSKFDQKKCDDYEYPQTDVRHFKHHLVTKLVEVKDSPYWEAHSAEGDWRRGTPLALLKRLREWRV